MRMTFRGALASAAVLAVAAPAFAQPSRETAAIDPVGIQRLMAESGGRARVSLHPATGAVRFLRIEPGAGAATLAPSASQTARQSSEGFLREHAGIFGIRDVGAELRVVGDRVDRLGHHHLTYQQVFGDVPVFGAFLKSHLDGANRLRAVNGTFVPGISLDTRPGRSASEAGAAALALVAAAKPEAEGLAAGRTTLYVFREGLLKGVPGPNRLAWEVEVGNGRDVREFVYVDAHNGKAIDQITGIHDGLNRQAYDGQYLNGVPPSYPAAPFWVEGDALPTTGVCAQLAGFPPCNEEADNMLFASEETYDLFLNAFGRDSFDGAGARMDSIFDRGYGCPNASWNGVFISFCPGTTTDDVTAHEWGHAYTEYTHGLIYQWQSGALNESYSDIWGEVVDLLNGRGTDSPGGLRAADSCSVFTALPPVVTVNAPAAIAGEKAAGTAQFGPQTFSGVTGDVVLADDGGGAGTASDGCEPFVNAGDVAGNIALVDRGTCAFVVKAQNAQAAGAIALIVANNTTGIINMAGTDPTLVIPSLSVLQTDGAAIKAQLAIPETVNATLARETGSDNSVRWLVGEDALAFNGAIRDMWNPTCYSNPGRVQDEDFYFCGTGDNGGVHFNSGVPNHAFALLVDGGTYNGQTVGAIGLTKAAHLYYRAQTVYQNPATDFAEHADALEQSCVDLVGSPLSDLSTGGPSGESISAADCVQVAAAVDAVELREPPDFCGFTTLLDPVAPDRCELGTERVDIFAETFSRNPALRGWTVAHEAVVPADFTPRDWEWVGTLPDDRPGQAMFAADPDIGTCAPGGDESGVQRLTSPLIHLPGGASAARLTFDHWVATEGGWDGGNVEISVNGGAWQLVDPSAFTFNNYNALLFPAPANTNPLAGQPAFTGADGGSVSGSWGRSHVELGAWAAGGDTIQLRYNLGNDGCFGLIGWYVDTVDVYACTPETLPNVTVNDVAVREGTPGGAPAGVATFKVSLSHPTGKPVWVWYRTTPWTARQGADFTPTSGVLRIAPLETEAEISVPIVADGRFERDEVFLLVLPVALNATVVDPIGTGTILNDD